MTLGVLGLVAVFGALPEASSALVYDRERILAGEVWRMITGNGVHFSKSHFAYDVFAFGVAGLLIELRGHRGFRRLCFLAPVLIGAVVFVTQRDLQIFGGLSGVATAAMVFLCLHGLREQSVWRWVCVLALIAVLVKTGFEFVTGELAFVQGGGIIIKPVPEAHLAGVVSAIVVWCSTTGTRGQAVRAPKAVLPAV
jgi:rhomboid family GlyGly-CTERM serine protease